MSTYLYKEKEQLFSIAFLLTKVGRKLSSMYGEELKKELNITPIQSGVLYVTHVEKMVESRNLTKILFVEKAYLSRAIAELVQRGLIEMKSSKEDARVKKLYLTKKGTGLIDKIKEIDEKMNKDVISSFKNEADVKSKLINILNS